MNALMPVTRLDPPPVDGLFCACEWGTPAGATDPAEAYAWHRVTCAAGVAYTSVTRRRRADRPIRKRAS